MGKFRARILFLAGVLLTAVLIFSGNKAVKVTSTDQFCASCHIHPQATQSWKQSTHTDNLRGIRVHCVECHLPPYGEGYLTEKIHTGMRDVWGKLFKDPETMNWEAKSQAEYAKEHVFESSCIRCHQNNFPIGLTEAGREAHLYYDQYKENLHCINCHITVGHYDPTKLHIQNIGFGSETAEVSEVYTEPGAVDGLNSFTEYIPGTRVSFRMMAIPGGTFMMGSPDDEPFRNENEGPAREVTVSSFFMGRVEVSWNDYLAFFKQTAAEGKTADSYLNVGQAGEVDAISGPTPPWGAPDQGWGKGEMPAITMTHHAAEVYCQWLSQETGKKYRLSTEAEWEYAARGGTRTPYFFEGDPRKFVRQGLRNKVFGIDTANINSYIAFAENSQARTVSPETKGTNPFGLVNMLGNVAEFCGDWYAVDAYSQYSVGPVQDPAGPESGAEHVVRGGTYKDGADRVRSASRDHSRHDAWLKTDPQIPKSIWWYSDCTFVGFRVVCEFETAE